VIKNVTLDFLVSVAYKNVFAKMEPIVMSNLELASVKLAGMVHTARNPVLMVIGVKNARKFVLVPKMDQNAITCLANVNAAPVIMAITVMNYVPLVPSEAAAQKYAFVELAHMTVTQSMVVASVSLATLDLCVTKNAPVEDGVKTA